MTNLAVVNATGGTVYLKAAGAGTSGDPHVPEQAISGTVAATGPLTNAELRAATVPISGTVAVTGPLTDAQLRAAAVPTAVGSIALPNAVYSGRKTVTSAGTSEALAASQALVSGVTIKALASNTGIIYVGNSGVSAANGYELAAGEQVYIEIGNLATVYVDAAVSGEGVTYCGA